MKTEHNQITIQIDNNEWELLGMMSHFVSAYLMEEIENKYDGLFKRDDLIEACNLVDSI